MYCLRLLCVQLWRDASLDGKCSLQGAPRSLPRGLSAVLNVAGTLEVLSFTTVLFVFQIKKPTCLTM